MDIVRVNNTYDAHLTVNLLAQVFEREERKLGVKSYGK